MAKVASEKPLGKKRVAKRPDPLAKYRGKRDFARTREPRGNRSAKDTSRFVVQKHAATRLHFDFRLEINGVLKSWAVPKGIPTKPGEKHLAVMVEDHPLDYAGFEGTIPKGEYGGGTVMLWDRGTFRVGGDEPAEALREGKLHLFLTGEKLHGEWALVRTRQEDQWLLLKVGAALRPVPRKWERSVASDRTLQEIAATVAMPAFVEPMKAKPVTALPSGDEWHFELKLDGYRFLAGKAGRDVRLWSRAGHDFGSRFPEIASAMAKLRAHAVLVDGELVVPDELGRPSFSLIQNAATGENVRAVLFDLLEVDGEDLRGQPCALRRARLAAIMPKRSDSLMFSGELAGEPTRLLAEVRERGLEGLIAKRRDSPYEAGRRSGAWRKIKCLREQEFVIGGFTPPKGGRSAFGALLVGYYRGRNLIFAGKVGTGFNQAMLVSLHRKMLAKRRAKKPFSLLPTKRRRWGTAFTRAELSRCTWVEPVLVAQVRFTEWTEDGLLRHPAFLGLREEKRAREVVRET